MWKILALPPGRAGHHSGGCENSAHGYVPGTNADLLRPIQSVGGTQVCRAQVCAFVVGIVAPGASKAFTERCVISASTKRCRLAAAGGAGDASSAQGTCISAVTLSADSLARICRRCPNPTGLGQMRVLRLGGWTRAPALSAGERSGACAGQKIGTAKSERDVRLPLSMERPAPA